MRSMAPMRSVADFIEALGGSTTVASLLSLPATTVASWKGRNSIPVERWPQLIDAARERGVEGCDYALLVSMQTGRTEAAE